MHLCATKKEHMLSDGDGGTCKTVDEQDNNLFLDPVLVSSLHSWMPEKCNTKRRRINENNSHSAPVRPVVDDLFHSAAIKHRLFSPNLDTSSSSSPTCRPSFKSLLTEDVCASIISPTVAGASVLGSSFFTAHPPSTPLRLVPIAVTASPLQPTELASVNMQIVWKVHAILNDLLASLPLNERSKCESETPTVTTYRRSSTAPSVNTQVSENRCTVATQAQELLDYSDSACRNAASPLRAMGGWRGGVRALRDSHVKLVLRQLRHVERLNRALDSTPVQPRRSYLANTRINEAE